MGEQLSPEVLAQVEALWVLRDEERKAEMNEYIEISRTAAIENRKREFARPEDKRAVGFICSFNYDLEDFCGKFRELLDENQEIKDVTTNVEKVTKFLKYCVSFGDKLSKRFNKEFESYQVANNLHGGWATERFFRQGEIFDRNLKEKSWMDREEEGSEEKAKRFQNAEQQAAIERKEKEMFAKSFPQRGGIKRTRFNDFLGSLAAPSATSSAAPYPSAPYPSAPHPSAPYSSVPSSALSGAASSLMFGPSQIYHPPGAAQVQCYGCWGFGHLQKNCPQKSRR